MPESDATASAATASAAPSLKGPEVFSREYVEELRRENASYRTRAQGAKAEAEAKLAEAEAQSAAAAKAAGERILRAELKAEALKAGMVDLDGLKLADLSQVRLAESGEVEGADALVAALKEAKPWLFGPLSTTNPEKAPPKTPPRAQTARDMRPEDWARYRKERGLR